MPKKVLIVDDEETNRDLFRQLLQTRNCETLEASNGKQALALLKQETFDLILLDLFMTDGDGLMVIREVRENVETRTIPIIVITAASNEEIHNRISEAGCDALIRKPVDINVLLETVDQFLGAE